MKPIIRFPGLFQAVTYLAYSRLGTHLIQVPSGGAADADCPYDVVSGADGDAARQNEEAIDHDEVGGVGVSLNIPQHGARSVMQRCGREGFAAA